jgi:hypothetical protein
MANGYVSLRFTVSWHGLFAFRCFGEDSKTHDLRRKGSFRTGSAGTYFPGRDSGDGVRLAQTMEVMQMLGLRPAARPTRMLWARQEECVAASNLGRIRTRRHEKCDGTINFLELQNGRKHLVAQAHEARI